MDTHEFTIIASGLDPQADDFEDRLFEAGCDDATIALQKGAIIIEFSREADSFAEAVISAYRDVQSAGAHIDRFEPDHLVSLSEIAERSSLTRQAISLYTRGERGEDFPHPTAKVTSKHPLWDWCDVAEWLHARGQIGEAHVVEARIVKAANGCVAGVQPAAVEFERRLGGA